MFRQVGRLFAFVFRDRGVAAIWMLLLGLAGVAWYSHRLDAVYAIKSWLFWQLATIWGWVGLFTAACASFGQLIVARVLRLRDLRTLESAVLGMACGVLAFTWFMYLAGAFSLYGPVFAVALPLSMIVVSFRDGRALLRQALQEFRMPALRSPFTGPATALGVLCVAIVYLGIMTPDSLNYDTTWCHMTVAQDYAREHGIVAFPADYNKNVPQLHSLIYCWGFLVPGLTPPLRWMLALHSEFGLFLWTLAGTGAGISALLGGKTLRGTWAMFFLFPIIFVYDSNLGGAADHICAFFAAPLLIALLRFCRTFKVSEAALLACASAGMLLTKYQAAYLLVPAAGIVLLHAGWYLVKARFWRSGDSAVFTNKHIALGLFALVGLGVVLVCPHFVRNIIYYRNPVYPYLGTVFTGSRPRVPNGDYYVEYLLKDLNARPRGSALTKLKHATELWFTFSVDPHYTYSNNWPAFGSLFTLLLPLIPFARHRARIAIAAAVSGGALFIWAITYNVDRNLQTFLPVIVCATGALIIEGFRLGSIARVGLVPLVGLQLVWGADALFYSGSARIEASLSLIESGFKGRADVRLDGYRSEFLAIQRALPIDAKVLLHDGHVSLGIDREVVLDWQGFQGLINYDALHTPRELFDYYRGLGITHLIQIPHQWPTASKQEEVLWELLTTQYARRVGNFGPYEVFALPSRPPPQEAPYSLGAFGLAGYGDGIYPIQGMSANQHVPPEKQRIVGSPNPVSMDAPDLPDTLASLDAVFLGHGAALGAQAQAVLNKQFKSLVRYDSYFTLYVNRRHEAR